MRGDFLWQSLHWAGVFLAGARFSFYFRNGLLRVSRFFVLTPGICIFFACCAHLIISKYFLTSNIFHCLLAFIQKTAFAGNFGKGCLNNVLFLCFD